MAESAGRDGRTRGIEQAIELPVWTLLPFVALLLAIALVPLVAPHFWASNRNKGVVVALLFLR